MNDLPYFDVVYGSSSNMAILRNKEVNLVVTNPPYYPKDLGGEFKKDLSEQLRYDIIKEQVTEFALSLRPIYNEISRVVADGGYVCLQISDLSYGGFLISLSHLHIQMLESCGFKLLHRFYCKGSYGDQYRHPIVEDILVFTNGGQERIHPLDINSSDRKRILNPFWVIPINKKNRAILVSPFSLPSPTPREIVRRLVTLYSSRGDLVLDPFSGSGTTLKVALKMGRRAVGYDIDPNFVKASQEELKR